MPISAQLRYNIEVICQYICSKIPVPKRDFISPARLIVIRSFDVNKPGYEVEDLKGGVAGGSILRGVLRRGQVRKSGLACLLSFFLALLTHFSYPLFSPRRSSLQEIEVRPGIVSKDEDGTVHCKPIFSRVLSLNAERNELQYAVPGGLIGVGTLIDPTLCRADRLVGQMLGAVGSLPQIYVELEVSFYLLRRLLGVKTEGDQKAAKVQKLSKGEVLMVNIGSLSTGGRVLAVKADLAKIALNQPVCTEVGCGGRGVQNELVRFFANMSSPLFIFWCRLTAALLLVGVWRSTGV